MREKAIPDELIPSADPAAVVAQYEPLIKKVARQYISILERSGAVGLEDLHQVARMVILRAQKTYIPSNASFFTFIYKPIHWAIRRALGFDNRTGAAPPWLVYLDEPLPGIEDAELTRVDVLADPEAVPIDEPIIEDETRRETSAEVRAAVARLKSERQREIIRRVYFDGETRQAAADGMGIGYKYFTAEERNARRRLRKDERLRYIAMPSFSVGLGKFRHTMTSAVEAAVIWRDEHLKESVETEAEEPAQGRQWSAARWMAYAEQIRRRHQEQAATGS